MRKFHFILLLMIGLLLNVSAQEFDVDYLCDVLPETATIEVVSNKPISYMSITVSDDTWLNGVYEGWCVDQAEGIDQNIEYPDSDVYCSYEVLEDGIIHDTANLDLVNWVINQRYVGTASDCGDVFTVMDVQNAIWYLVDDQFETAPTCQTLEIIAEAETMGEGYEPGIGDYVAVIFDPGEGIQVVIIAFPIECVEDCGPCEGKLTHLDLEYQGEDVDYVEVYRKDKGSTKLLVRFDNVVNGQILNIVGDDDKGTMGTEIQLTTDGETFTKIHTSCSVDLYINDIYGDYKIVAGISREGGPLCEGSGTDCGDCEGGLTSLDLEYLGTEAANIKVYAEKKGGEEIVYFKGEVQPNGIFSFVGTGKDGKMEKNIFVVIGNDETKIHTSCSGDGIYINQVFDELYKVVAGISKDGGPLCEEGSNDECGDCDGGLTSLDLKYLGENAANIKVYAEKKGGEEIVYFEGEVQPNGIFNIVGTGKDGKMEKNIFVAIGDDETKIHTSCSGDGIYISQVFDGLYEVVAGVSKKGGPLCEYIPSPPDFCEDCGDCKGGLISLGLRYLGEEAVNITVYAEKKNNDDIIYFEGIVQPGGEFSFVGTGKDGKMEKNIFVVIGDDETKIHTSCSGDGIYINQVFDGLYEVVSGSSKDGGRLCKSTFEDCGDCKGGLTSLDLEYLGTTANIKVYGKKKNGDEIVYFNGEVQPKGIIHFVGNGKDGKMEKDVYIVMGDDVTETYMHTSCSGAGIFVGQVFDNLYKVVAGISKDGGPLCENGSKSSEVRSGYELKDVVIYPNPMSNSGTIEFVAAQDGRALVEIYNILGEKVSTLYNGTVQANGQFMVSFNSSNLAKGMYIVIVRNETTIYKQKISVVK